MKRSVRFLAGGLLLTAPLGVQAQASDPQLRMDRGFYISGGIGKVRTDWGCVAACDQTDRSWNLSAGYQFNRHLGLEAGYVDLGKLTVTGAIFGGVATADVKTKALELLGVGTLPFTDKFAVYVKAGLFRSDSDAVFTGAVAGSGSEKKTGFTFAGGLQYSITPNAAARFEWQTYNDVGTGVVGLDRGDLTVWRLAGRYMF